MKWKIAWRCGIVLAVMIVLRATFAYAEDRVVKLGTFPDKTIRPKPRRMSSGLTALLQAKER
jgi:hypothetical protein